MTSDYIFTKDIEINKETIHEGDLKPPSSKS